MTLLALPRLVVPLLILAGFGMLLNMCHPPCPVDPLSSHMVCLGAEDPQGYARALEAAAGVKKTRAQWEAEAVLQRELEAEQAAMAAQHSIDDYTESARRLSVEDQQRCKSGYTEYCRAGVKKPSRRHHRAVPATIREEESDE